MLRDGSKTRGERGEVLPDPHEGPPDSYHPSGLCPRCRKQSSFQVIGSIPLTFEHESFIAQPDGSQEPDYCDRVSVLVCRHCKQGVNVVEEKWIGDKHHSESSSGIVSWRGIFWWPIPDAQLSSDIPSNIAEAYNESVRAIAANCPRASVVMARRALEAVTADKGETSGVLAARLNNLAANEVLHPTLEEWAKEVRLIGNVGAHFDPISAVSIDDAKQLQRFLAELLKYLYELPAELQRLRNP